MRSDVSHLNQAALARRKLLARIFRQDIFSPDSLFFLKQRENGLNGGADRDGFVRIHVVNERRGGELGDHLAHHRHPRHSADEQYLIDLSPFHSRFLHHHFADGLAFLDQMPCLDARNLRASDRPSRFARCDCGRSWCERRAAELDLGGERPALQVLITLQVEKRIFAVRSIKFLGDVIDDDVVPVFPAEPMIAIGGQHLDACGFQFA